MEYEDRITLLAPEGLELEYTLAGVGSRFIAELADLVVQVAVFAALVGILVAVDAGNILRGIAVIVYLFSALFGYDVAFEVWGGGRTPGKRLTGIRVLRASGQPITFGPSAVRNLLRILDVYVTLSAVGFISILVTRSNQRVGDLAAGSIVVRDRYAALAPAPLQSTASGGQSLPALDVTAITAEELATVRDFLGRRRALEQEPRARVGAALADRLRPKVGGLPGEDLSAEQLLEAIAFAKSGGQAAGEGLYGSVEQTATRSGLWQT